MKYFHFKKKNESESEIKFLYNLLKIEMFFSLMSLDNLEMNESYDQQMQVEEQQQECEAHCYGRCEGQLVEHTAIWHVRPRTKDIARGHRPCDTTLPVVLCTYHYKQIITNCNNGDKLPEMYGWDAADAIDEMIFGYLEYTGQHYSAERIVPDTNDL